jgi:hypothetical protein
VDILLLLSQDLILFIQVHVLLVGDRVVRVSILFAEFLDNSGVGTLLVEEVFVFHNPSVRDFQPREVEH